MIKIYKKVWLLFDREEEKQAKVLLVLMVFMASMEIVGISSIIPFLSVISDKNVINDNGFLKYLYSEFNFTNINSFLIFLGLASMLILLLSTVIKILTYYKLYKFSNDRRHNISLNLFTK